MIERWEEVELIVDVDLNLTRRLGLEVWESSAQKGEEKIQDRILRQAHTEEEEEFVSKIYMDF